MALSPLPNVSHARRGRKRLVLVTTAAGALLLVVLAAALLVRGLPPRTRPVLRLTPAAGAVDDQTTLLLTGSGWRRNEDVAICASSTNDGLCDADHALAVVRADRRGVVEADVLAGPLLGQGLTTFIANGLESGQVATRSFRVLEAATPQTDVAPGRLEESGASEPSVSIPITETPPLQGVVPAGESWLGEYFASPDLSGTPLLTRNDPELAFDWTLETPDPLLPPDGFSVRWSRRLSLPGGRYRFLAEANGGLRLTIDGQTVIDEWQDPGMTTAHTAVVELFAGAHDVMVTFMDLQGAASLALRWEASDSFVDWRGEYYANPDLSGEPSLVRNDAAVDFDWGEASPAPGLVPVDGFSARWTRALPFAEGLYRFAVMANDGARVLVDNQVLLDAWNASSDQRITADTQLTGGDHQITVVFVDNAGPARVTIGWSPIPAATPVGVANEPTVFPTPQQTGEPEITPTPTASPISTSTSTVSPGSTFTPTPTVPPGSTFTPTPTAPPGSTLTPTPTMTPTSPPGSTSSPPPTATVTPTPQLDVGLEPAEARIGDQVTVKISGQWPPGVTVYVVMLPYGMTIPPPVGQPVYPLATWTTSNDGSAVEVDIAVPDDPQLQGAQLVKVVVYTDGWSHYQAEPFTIIG